MPPGKLARPSALITGRQAEEHSCIAANGAVGRKGKHDGLRCNTVLSSECEGYVVRGACAEIRDAYYARPVCATQRSINNLWKIEVRQSLRGRHGIRDRPGRTGDKVADNHQGRKRVHARHPEVRCSGEIQRRKQR